MKIYVVLLVSIIFCLGCKSFHYTRSSINGTYILQTEFKQPSGIELSFSDKTFNLVDVGDFHKIHKASVYICCDTITRGTWELDSRHGTLTMNTLDLSSYITASVKEERGLSRDSVYFFVTAPVLDTVNDRYNKIDYKLSLGTTGDLWLLTEDKIFHRSRIAISNRQRNRVFSIQLWAQLAITYGPNFRNNGMGLGHILFYQVKNQEANIFRVNMPELTYPYITYLRFEERVVKIVNQSELILDGKIYKKIR